MVTLIVPIVIGLVALSPWLFSSYHLDTDVYRQGAQAFLAGEDLYTQLYSVDSATLPFTYPPFAALVFTPLAVAPLWLGGLLLSAASLGCLWWVIYVAVGRRARLTSWVFALACVLEPVRDTISFGQVNLILMALVVTDLLCLRTSRWHGALAGVAAAIKLTPAVFIVALLVQRRWRAAGTMVASAVAATLVAGALAPTSTLTYLTEALGDPGRIGGLSYATNQSLSGVLERLAIELPGLWEAGCVVVIAGVIAAAWRWRADPLMVCALVSVIALLCSPVSWSHHWVWLIVVALAWLPNSAGVAALVAAASLIAPHRLLPHGSGFEMQWPWWADVIGNAYVLLAAGIVVLAAACGPEFFSRRISDGGARHQPKTGIRDMA
ncbi:putative DUF2029 family protein [Corynebacterium uterequi]|uniref:Putative DUF2029 family protein n=1 Tax=Corynebacterium uterequi TaxID=1072256 RepID=A0A0G3HFF9_9CORY|nr:putative DUF2029 family protein [Corynebacterium uterequi]